MAMRGLGTATIATKKHAVPITESLKCKAEMMRVNEDNDDKGQKSTREKGFDAPKPPAGAFFIFMDKSGNSLWMLALLLLSIAHLAQAADTTAAATAELDFLSIAWSILILMTMAVGLVAFGGVLIYCLDLLSYMTLFRTGVYDIIHGLVCERMGFDESNVGMVVYGTMSMLFKHIGRPFRHVIHSLLGSQVARCWIILWKLQCQIYAALCRRLISLEHDSFLLLLIKIVGCLLNVLGSQRFGIHWWWMTEIGSQLHILLVGLFYLWLRLGFYLS